MCARRRTASAQQLSIKHVHHMVGWAGWSLWEYVRTVVPYHVVTPYPCGQPGLSSLCDSLEVLNHADWTVPRHDVNSPFSPCVCHPATTVFAHTQVRDPRDSDAACEGHALGTPFAWLSVRWPFVQKNLVNPVHASDNFLFLHPRSSNHQYSLQQIQ